MKLSKPDLKRIVLWSLPLIVPAVALWRLQEARSWQPRVLPLTPLGVAIVSPEPMPVTWRRDGLRLFAPPIIFSSAISLQTVAHRAVWKKQINWNGEAVPISVATDQVDSRVTFARDAPVLAGGYDNGSLEIWREGRLSRVVREKPVPNRLNLQKPGKTDFAALALSPDGGRLAGGSQLRGYFDSAQMAKGFSPLGIVLWDAKTGRQIARQSSIEGAFTAVEFSGDGTQLAGTTCDGYLFVLDAKTGQKRRVWRAHRWLATTLAWSPDGKFLVSGTNPRSAYSYQWKSGGGGYSNGISHGSYLTRDAKDEAVIIDLRSDSPSVNGWLDRDLKLWDATTGKLQHKWRSATGITGLQWSPDGHQIAVGTYGEALLFDAKTWAITRRFALPVNKNAPLSVAFAPDGRTLAVASSQAVSFYRLK